MHFIRPEDFESKRSDRAQRKADRIARQVAEREQFAKEERQATEKVLIVERASKAASFLRWQGNVGIVAKGKADIKKFTNGIEMSKFVSGNVKWYQADGNVQGEPKTNADLEAAKFSQLVSEVRREDGFSVIGFLGVDFEAEAGGGNPDIIERLKVLTEQQHGLPMRERYLGILGIGRGKKSNVPTFAPDQCTAESDFLRLLDARFVLDKEGELSMPVGPQKGIDYTANGQSPAHADAESQRSRAEIPMEFGGTRL